MFLDQILVKNAKNGPRELFERPKSDKLQKSENGRNPRTQRKKWPSTIPAHPYFLPKTGEHDVTMTSFTADLWKPWKIPLVSVCEIDEERGMQSSVAISPFVFLSYGKKRRGGGAFRPSPIEAWVNCRYQHRQNKSDAYTLSTVTSF